LPAGKDLVCNCDWQRIPGAADSNLYPFTRKIDTVSANSYVIATPDQLIVIDPGGLREQTDHLIEVVRVAREEDDLPVFVYLTHAHVDHSLEVTHHPWFKSRDIYIAAHEKGARAIEGQDRVFTLATLFRQEPGYIDVPIKLHAGTSASRRHSEDLDLEGRILSLKYTDYGKTLGQCVNAGEGPSLGVFHTPGHSPDSICIRVGNILFLGDLLFAASPGIAGVTGWSHASLKESIVKVLTLLEQGEITLCCPGHGRVVTSATTIAILKKMQKDLDTLSGIAEVNPEWARETATYADDLMDRLSEIFTVIAGRLYFASHMMEELEESGEAARLAGLIRSDTIDELLAEFSGFAEENRTGRGADIDLALKAGQIVQKLDSIFEKEQLSNIIDPSLIRRAGRLLSDYMTTFRGFCPQYEIEPVDLNVMVPNLLARLNRMPGSDEGFLEAAGNEEEYIRMLAARIAQAPVFEETEMRYHGNPALRPVSVNEERLGDMITSILEEFVGSGEKVVSLIARPEETYAVLDMIGGKTHHFPIRKPRTWRFLRRECALSGCTLGKNGAGDRLQILMPFWET